MSSTFKYHSQVNEVVPWQASYTFPSQATKVNKQTVKLVPKNGGAFTSGNIIRIEFPSDNYLNVLNSVLQFDFQIHSTPVFTTATMTSNTDVTFEYNKIIFTEATAGTASPGAYPAATTDYSGYILTLTRLSGTGSGYTEYAIVQSHLKATSTHTFTLAGAGVQNIALPATQSVKISLYPPYMFQRGGAQNLIKRLRVMYGSLVLEDIYEYKSLVRVLFECGVSQDYAQTHGQIVDGMYGSCFAEVEQDSLKLATQYRTTVIPTNSLPSSGASGVASFITPGTTIAALQLAPPVSTTGTNYASTTSFVTSTKDTRYRGTNTFCLNLLSGVLTQKKLLPLKWMAAQFAIEITLATEADCLLSPSSSTPTYYINNVNFIAEMLEFDSAYDTAFYDGLRSRGVPIKFSSFHFHSFNISGQNNTIQIHERARSVKFGFAVARDTNAVSVQHDSDRFFHDLGASYAAGLITDPGAAQVTQFQWRIGGRYYPAQPVRCLYGGPEAYIELQKTLDNLGDYTRGSMITANRWTCHNTGLGSTFIMAAPFENADLYPDTISGINAEEQSDIALNIVTEENIVDKKLDVFMSYDALIIVRDGNVIDLVL